jgi:hypothetical protein
MTVALASMIGLAIGILVWMLAIHFVAVWLNRIEDRNPALAGSQALKMYEIVACSVVFAGCLALALWLSRIVWLQINH